MTLAGDRLAASFRDPAGYVFLREGRVFRAVSSGYAELFDELDRDGLLAELTARQLIPTTRVTEEPLAATLRSEHPEAGAFLEHDRIDPVTYPYEWPVSMLADAGIATLDLQLRLLRAGLSLKDASAYNIQFHAGRPVFIDLTSIERPPRLDVWYALGQFGQMFTFPLLLFREQGWDLRSYFLGSLGGRTLEQVARSFGGLERLRPALLLDLTLPLWAGRRVEGRDAAPPRPAAAGAGNPAAQRANLGRLRAKLRKLADGYRPAGVWAAYTRSCTYDTAASAAKRDRIRAYLERWRPPRVLDLGCNTGEYSYLAAGAGARVVAVDSDHDAIETLYRRLRQEPASISPIVADLANPSPAIGFGNRERASLLERLGADAVFALALLHHLLVSANLSLELARDALHDLTTDHLVLEFVPPEDPMFRRLLRFRNESFDWLTLSRCRSVFGERFTLVEEHAVPGTPRTLLFLRRLPR